METFHVMHLQLASGCLHKRLQLLRSLSLRELWQQWQIPLLRKEFYLVLLLSGNSNLYYDLGGFNNLLGWLMQNIGLRNKVFFYVLTQ